MQCCKQRNIYLITYGVISTFLWLLTLIYTISGLCKGKYDSELPPTHMIILRFSQSFAALDILNSLVGLVKSRTFPTLIQVSSRLHIVWIVFYLSPLNSKQVTTVYSYIMIISWCISELIRYPYYVVGQLSLILPSIRMPLFLKWLRYSGFAILYPIGIIGEVVICSHFISDIYKNSSSMDVPYKKLRHFPSEMPNSLNFEVNLAFVYIFILLLYIPGSIFMYSYMIKQRKKSLTNLWKVESEQNLKAE
ncbi:hypothetical protein FG386_003040 [Cryptosporidium ryanae]|uniref:uncharacterized protein n=1 Tax=Cryptosporidium ryanae TaxID=515981 RepID=UPI00351A0705|nr:hypothetical protein FG386_003040 [Cryptosporidium ryanae]